ncbi:hypothetical protein C8R43DRAFT_656300 [Mycena crocata]|nr:hypothetical protein C8R43DRAFT_656300 [Mycena crocata]
MNANCDITANNGNNGPNEQGSIKTNTDALAEPLTNAMRLVPAGRERVLSLREMRVREFFFSRSLHFCRADGDELDASVLAAPSRFLVSTLPLIYPSNSFSCSGRISLYRLSFVVCIFPHFTMFPAIHKSKSRFFLHVLLIHFYLRSLATLKSNTIRSRLIYFWEPCGVRLDSASVLRFVAHISRFSNTNSDRASPRAKLASTEALTSSEFHSPSRVLMDALVG